MNLELIFGNHQEEDIDQMILDAEIYEDDQGMKRIPDDVPLQIELPPGTLNGEEEPKWEDDYQRARQNGIREKKQCRVRWLLTALGSLSVDLFAAISVAERQIAVLQDLHGLFLTSCRTKIKDYEKRYPLPQNRFYKNIAPIPILSENSEQIWLNTLDTIDQVVRGRKCFIKQVKELVGNMEMRRKIV